MNRVEKIIEEFESHYSKEKKSVHKGNIVNVLIATKLSQNTTDKTSIIAYRNLKNRFKSWDDVADAKLSEIKKLIRPCGLTETKSMDIKQMLNDIKSEFGSVNLNHLRKLKDETVYKELTKYKGIGVKTASCVLAFALGRDVFPVDTHIHRILNRTGIVKTKTPEDTFEKAKKLIPKGKKIFFHVNLIKFGRNVCKAQKPLCNNCFIYDHCSYEMKEMYSQDTGRKTTKENNFIILENVN